MVGYRDKTVRLIRSPEAEELYREVRDLPIIDYHCHLSPEEIYEDRPFGNIGEIWLLGDHYNGDWREASA